MTKKTARFPVWFVLLLAEILIGFLGYLDYATGDYSLLIFYLAPIFLCAWFIGARAAVVISLSAGAARIISDFYSYSTADFRYWNSVEDLFFLLMSGLLVALIRRLLVEEQSRWPER